ncbi:MAG: hypothetical protein AB1689_24345 [Thermodesulfobacteriota bacterium]
MRRYVSMLALALAFTVPAAGAALADSERRTTTTTTTTTTEPTGRLVITDEQTRSFRVGDDTKVYVAPPGVELSELSGKGVKVYIDDEGRVSRITRSQTTTVEED